ncbi:lipoprotein [Pasteurellaceae bacterium TAE3-ERU1]|nr:lipoprotein [Spirabiliibacterium mucosae]MBE2898782.1 lipoprotein [Spirabiliibacterium mucosae]MBV7388487.1 lipoprotein [Pasteurellaceae bacterium TAE3-ERU1]
MKTAILTALAAFCLCSLASCGVKGPLYFPADDQKAEQSTTQALN